MPLNNFFNTNGKIYKEEGLKDKLPHMSEQEQYEKLATDGMLVKRPVLLKDEHFLMIGFRQEEWEKRLL